MGDKRYPTCRLVLSAQGTLDLINRIQKINAALAREGAIETKSESTAPDKAN